MALPRLARLHQDLGNRKQAAACYQQLLTQNTPSVKSSKVSASGLSAEVIEALKFMMQFHKDEGNVVECEMCATQLLDTGGPEKDEAKAMLRDLRREDNLQSAQQPSNEALAPRRF